MKLCACKKKKGPINIQRICFKCLQPAIKTSKYEKMHQDIYT